MMGPLVVTFGLGSPLVTHGDPIHLDALLAFVRLRHGEGTRLHEAAWEPAETVGLPLARMQFGTHWWYRASAVQPAGAASRTSWSKQWACDQEDALDLGQATQLTLRSGRYKLARVPMELVNMPKLRFYAVGDRRVVKKLAQRLSYIGAKGSQGYGRVIGCTVDSLVDGPAEAFDGDYQAANGGPARNLPAEFCRERGIPFIGTRIAPLQPPYWRVLERNVTDVAILTAGS